MILKMFAAVADTNAIKSLRFGLRQNGLMIEWSNNWLMLFNIDKCKVLHFCYKQTLNMIMCWMIRF